MLRLVPWVHCWYPGRFNRAIMCRIWGSSQKQWIHGWVSRYIDLELLSSTAAVFLAYQFPSAMCRWCHGGGGNAIADPGATGKTMAVLDLGFARALNLFYWYPWAPFLGFILKEELLVLHVPNLGKRQWGPCPFCNQTFKGFEGLYAHGVRKTNYSCSDVSRTLLIEMLNLSNT